MSKKGLGRGLGALLGDENVSEHSPGLREIYITEITPNPDQPRQEFDQEQLKELAESIKLHGLLQPILVQMRDGGYYIIAGERRYRAAKLAGLTKIACLVQECTALEMAERALVENIQRSDLSPVEEGLAYLKLIKEYGLTQEDIANRVGKGRATIANLLRVIQLPEPVLALLKEEKISLGHAKLLVGFDDTSIQVLAAQKIAHQGLSVRETEVFLAELNEEKKEKTKRKRAPLSISAQGIEDRLRSTFQTKVHLKGEINRGRIEIEYFSEEELNRLLELWHVQVD